MVIHCHVYMKDPFDAAQEGAVKNISGGLLCFSFVYMVEVTEFPSDELITARHNNFVVAFFG